MRRRSSAGGQPVKARHRKRSTPKGRNAPKTTRNRGVSIGQGKVVARLSHERDEALLRETANSEILRLISKSPDDLKLVFRTILENATRICNANFGILFRFDGENFHLVAHFNTPAALLEALTQRGPFKPTPGRGPLHEVIRTKQTIHVADLATSQPYREPSYRDDPARQRFLDQSGARTLLCVPLLQHNELVGAIAIYRQEVKPFIDKQIDLAKNFATQAVIAIKNARLLNELRQRTDDLSKALEQQTATSEVLRVISSSPGELQPVFEAILANAKRLCDAQFGILYLSDGDMLRFAADVGTPPKFAEFQRQRGVFRPRPGTRLEHVMLTKEISHTADLTATAVPDMSALLGGARSTVYVPMLKDEEIIGVICIYRQEVRPFTDKQVALVQNFADQAVIAIENARLLNELGQSLEQQTATADVLRVISSSPGELDPVFNAMLENATRICGANFGGMFRFENGALRLIAKIGFPQKFFEALQSQAHPPGPLNAVSRLIRTQRPVHIADYSVDEAYLSRDPMATIGVELAGIRTLLNVPMVKDGELVGFIGIFRQEVRPFTDKQIELVKNFAAQAVIAIENSRLLNELRERTEEVVKLNQQLEQRVSDQVGEIERMSRLRRFLPPQVADLIVASGTEKQLESHRREITALFCDLRGFTGFSESSDPEDVMALLRDYHAAIGQIVIKYSGTLERYAGDGVMVVFMILSP